MQAIRPYEIIYYLVKTNLGKKVELRKLYKYSYYLTKSDKAKNPSWSDFFHKMDELYDDFF